MTATRARAAQRGSWEDRALLPDRPGMPWWAAVLCALGVTAASVLADLERLNRLGVVFEVCYLLSCLLAVVVVQRKGLFAPMVAPPLILAVALLGIVLATDQTPPGSGMIATALAVGTPLINNFPTMAITTAITLAVGVFRLIVQRRPSARHSGEMTS